MSSTLAYTWASTFASQIPWRGRQGSHVANWAFSHFLRPVGQDED